MTMNETLPRTSADFFAGIGLVRCALERQGWSDIYSLDYSEMKSAIHLHHFGPSNYNVQDINSIKADDVPFVTLAHASFPCTDTSVAGGRKGLLGLESGAFWEFERLLSQMKDRRPPIILLENVEGFLTSNGGQDIHNALTALSDLGYGLDIFLIDASHFVPQSRVRTFIVGSLHTPPQSILEQTFILSSPTRARPAKITRLIQQLKNVRWALSDVPDLPERNIQLADIIDTTETWWPPHRTDYMLGQMHETHKTRIDKLMAQDAWSYGTVFRRMRIRDGISQSTAEIRTDGIAGCLRTPKGGSARQIVFRAGFEKFDARLLNARECARLMGADDYKLKESLPLNDALFGFGDAVCVPAVEWVLENAINPRYLQLTEAVQPLTIS